MIWSEARSNAAAVMSDVFSQLEKQRSVLFSIVYVWERQRESRLPQEPTYKVIVLFSTVL